MSKTETSGYAIIDGVIRKVRIFPGGVRRDGRHYVIAMPFNPKKMTQSESGEGESKLLIDPNFVSDSMKELQEKSRQLRSDTLQALTKWSKA